MLIVSQNLYYSMKLEQYNFYLPTNLLLTIFARMYMSIVYIYLQHSYSLCGNILIKFEI